MAVATAANQKGRSTQSKAAIKNIMAAQRSSAHQGGVGNSRAAGQQGEERHEEGGASRQRRQPLSIVANCRRFRRDSTRDSTRLGCYHYSSSFSTSLPSPPLPLPLPLPALFALFIEIYFFVAFYLLIFKSKVLKCAT